MAQRFYYEGFLFAKIVKIDADGKKLMYIKYATTIPNSIHIEYINRVMNKYQDTY